jgi:hypothetical protein
LKGKVYCAGCGHLMHRHRQNKDGIYWYRCQSQWKYAKNACAQVSVKEADLIEEIITLLQKQSEVIDGKLIELNGTSNKSMQDSMEAELREVNQYLNTDGRMLRSLYENMINGLITQAEFVQMKTDYETKIIASSARADEIRNALRDAECLKKDYLDMAEAVSVVIENDSLTAEIIERLVDKVLVHPDKRFEIYLRYSDEFGEVSA